jgi:hypothetical protein
VGPRPLRHVQQVREEGRRKARHCASV